MELPAPDEIIDREIRRESKIPKKPMPDAVSLEAIIELAGKYKPRDRFLFSWLYLTGQRISEALEIRRRDVTVETLEGKAFLMVDTLTLKNRQQPRRVIPVPMDNVEAALIAPVWAQVEPMPADARVLPITRQMAFNRLSRISVKTVFVDSKSKTRSEGYKKINPHYLRHCRATHMRRIYGFDSIQLMQFFGWASAAMPNTYLSFSGRHLAKEILGLKWGANLE